MLRYISLNSKNSHTEVIKNHTKVTVVQNIKKKQKRLTKGYCKVNFQEVMGSSFLNTCIFSLTPTIFLLIALSQSLNFFYQISKILRHKWWKTTTSIPCYYWWFLYVLGTQEGTGNFWVI